jgi:hypothetical protein
MCWTALVPTFENELTEPVDLCTPDGRHLNPAARGWSRHPLHRANLAGRWGRTKRWDYWAVLTDELIVSVTFADVDYLGIAAVEWIDVATGRCGGRVATVPFGRGIDLPDVHGASPLHYLGRHLELDIRQDGSTTHFVATWAERDGTPGSLDIRVTAPSGQESLNVVIPWSDACFQFTSKQQALSAHGSITTHGQQRQLGGEPGDAWGVLDVGRGRWPYRTRWNWAGGAGRSADGRLVGLQFGGKWTEGTGFTENGVIVDGRLVKIGEELGWDYRWKDPLRPWRVTSGSGDLDVTLHPVHDRHARTAALVLSTEVHQVFGHWSGVVPDGAGSSIRLEGLLGFAEESRSRW